MKFFNKEPEKTILFVCVENAGRSQMAEGFFNKYAPEGYKGISGGTKPVSQINPVAAEAMKEVNSYKIVNMGCLDKESCPTFFLPNVLDWNLEDPKGKLIEKVREIRDEIEQRVKLVASIMTSKEINV